MTAPHSPHASRAELDSERAHTMVRLLEAAPAVQRRHQFFVWSQAQLQPLVPHQLMVCAAYQRQQRQLVFDAFHSVVIATPTLDELSHGQSALLQWLSQAWVAGHGQPLAARLDQAPPAARATAAQLHDELGLRELLVHGVARPQRPEEIESLFILGGPPTAEGSASRLSSLDLVLPQLHRIWQRVASNEYALARPAEHGHTPPRSAPPSAGATPITARERQILQWVRDGRSNQQVAEVLGISPLTVKNHVQKILRKLDASNRAQAVSRAIAQGLLPSNEPGREA